MNLADTNHVDIIINCTYLNRTLLILMLPWKFLEIIKQEKQNFRLLESHPPALLLPLDTRLTIFYSRKYHLFTIFVYSWLIDKYRIHYPIVSLVVIDSFVLQYENKLIDCQDKQNHFSFQIRASLSKSFDAIRNHSEKCSGDSLTNFL